MDNKMIASVMGIVAFLSYLAGGMIIQDGTTPYLCEDTQQICVGTRLSSTYKTCYYLDDGEERGKRCLVEPYWEVYNNQNLKHEDTNGERFNCYPEPRGCEVI